MSATNVWLKRRSIVSVVPDQLGRFGIYDNDEGSGGFTHTRDGLELTGLSFNHAVRLAVHVAAENEADLRIDFAALADGSFHREVSR